VIEACSVKINPKLDWVEQYRFLVIFESEEEESSENDDVVLWNVSRSLLRS
jgi:hypothetical protein